jgi:hypothetical protein
VRVRPTLLIGCLVLGCAALLGCGSGTKTVTETVEVETRTTQGGSGGPISEVTRFCSSPEGEEIDAVSAEAGQALAKHNDAGLVESVETMIRIAEHSPPGARCVYAPFDSVKTLLSEHPDLIRRVSEVEQQRQLTLADVERVEREGNGEG